MSAHPLDTLAIAGKLKAAGFSEAQAEAMTFVLRDAREADASNSATKADLESVRVELKSDIRALELRLEAKIEAGKSETIKWVVSAIGFQTLVLVGAVVTMSRLFQP